MNETSRKKATQILSAEFHKLLTLPSIWRTLICTFIVNLSLTAAFTYTGLQEAAEVQSVLHTGLSSMMYVQAGFIILGILSTCSEYEGDQIRTTLIAMPWRSLQLAMKLAALAAVTLPVAFLIIVLSVLYAFIAMKDAAAIEMLPMIKILAGATGYLTLTTLLSAAVGMLFRRTTSALVVLLGYYFIFSPLVKAYLSRIEKGLPDIAGSYMYMPAAPGGMGGLTPLQGTSILAGWTCIFIVVAVACFRKRDS